MIKYKTEGWRGTPDPGIKILECERETEHCIWVKGRRYLKITENERYFDTWEEAHEYILALANKKVEGVRLQLGRAKDILRNIKGLKEVNNGNTD